MVLELPIDAGDVDPVMSLEARCLCGHRNPEHTAEGICDGCLTCLVDEESDHLYQRCECREFSLAEPGEQSSTDP